MPFRCCCLRYTSTEYKKDKCNCLPNALSLQIQLGTVENERSNVTMLDDRRRKLIIINLYADAVVWKRIRQRLVHIAILRTGDGRIERASVRYIDAQNIRARLVRGGTRCWMRAEAERLLRTGTDTRSYWTTAAHWIIRHVAMRIQAVIVRLRARHCREDAQISGGCNARVRQRSARSSMLTVQQRAGVVHAHIEWEFWLWNGPQNMINYYFYFNIKQVSKIYKINNYWYIK